MGVPGTNVGTTTPLKGTRHTGPTSSPAKDWCLRSVEPATATPPPPAGRPRHTYCATPPAAVPACTKASVAPPSASEPAALAGGSPAHQPRRASLASRSAGAPCATTPLAGTAQPGGEKAPEGSPAADPAKVPVGAAKAHTKEAAPEDGCVKAATYDWLLAMGLATATKPGHACAPAARVCNARASTATDSRFILEGETRGGGLVDGVNRHRGF